MRGKGALVTVERVKTRITPAYAGKRKSPLAAMWLTGDHPRVCGEKGRGYIKIWNEWGSPPRVRGKDTNDANTGATVGITPAYAGKSCRSPQGAGRAWDHPRVCGEKMMATAEAKAMEGSPPRMRGKVSGRSAPGVHV